jgi:hypothetical protein
MTNIRLTNNHYINPAAVATIAFDPTDTFNNQALFTVIFMNSDIDPLQLKGADAEDAFINLEAALEQSTKQQKPQKPLSQSVRKISFQAADSGILEVDLANRIKTNEGATIQELVTALVICARDCEIFTRNDPNATPIEKRLARAWFVSAMLSALTLTDDNDAHVTPAATAPYK